MSCNISIPMEEINEAVREELAKEFISIENGVGNNTTLNDPNIKGDVTFDSAARDALCSALAECVDEKLKALEDEIDGKIEDTEAALRQAISDAKTDLEADIDLLRKSFEDSQKQQDEAFDAKIAAQKELLEQAIAAGDSALDTRIDSLDTKVDHQREDLEKAIAAGDEALEDLRSETKIKSIERTDDTVTVELVDGTKFSFSVADDECNDCGRAVDFDISEDGNSLDITLADGTKLDLTHKELTDWLASKDGGSMATDSELKDIEELLRGEYKEADDQLRDEFQAADDQLRDEFQAADQDLRDALDSLVADKVSKDELCELAEPCIQDMLDELPPEKFISEHTVDGNKLISTYNTGGTIEVELPVSDTNKATLSIEGDDLVIKNEDGSESKVPLNSLIQISPDDGNEIEMRDNGIYYGTEAPPNLANLYVDGELGDDSVSVDDGGGSIDNPFKTLAQALRVSPEDKNNTIHLKATLSDDVTEQTYSMGRFTRIGSSVVRTIKTYGQPLLTDEVGSCLRTKDIPADVEFSAMFKRPKILMDWHVDEDLKRQRKQYVYLFSGGRLEFRGVHLVDVEVPMDENEYTVYNNFIAMGSGEVHFKACILEDHADIGATGTRYRIFGSDSSDSQTASFAQCYFENFRPIGSGLFNVRGALTMLVTSGQFTTQDAADHCLPEGSRDNSSLDSNAAEILSRPTLYQGLVRGNSGDPLNVTSNIVI